MSRSRRRTPIFGITTCESEKPDKQAWHRRWRRAAKQRGDHGEFDDERLHSDAWNMGKDGKQYRPDCPDMMRK